MLKHILSLIKKRKSMVETRNNADALVHGAQKSIEELGDKADPKLKSEVEKGISDLKSAIERMMMKKLKKKSEILSSIMMKMGERLQTKITQNETGEQQDNVDNKKKDEDESVVDADFEEVDNDQDQDVKKHKIILEIFKSEINNKNEISMKFWS